MFRQVYESATPEDFGETITYFNGMLLNSAITTGDSASSITLVSFGTKPGFAIGPIVRSYNFDGQTGARISSLASNVFDPSTYPDPIGNLLGGPLHQARDGSVWVEATVFGGAVTLKELNPIAPYDYTGLEYTSDHFEDRLVTVAPMIDKALDICLMAAELGKHYVKIYKLSTGEHLRDIPMPGAPTNIIPEDSRRCYVVTSDGFLTLLDYMRNVVIGVYKAPIAGSDTEGLSLSTSIKFAYDKVRKRLLTFGPVDPSSGVGQITTTIKGWVPIPLVTNLTAPVPLKPMRKGRDTAVLVHTCGDAGEPIGGLPVNVVSAGDITVKYATAISDAQGDAMIRVVGTAAGSADLTLTVEI